MFNHGSHRYNHGVPNGGGMSGLHKTFGSQSHHVTQQQDHGLSNGNFGNHQHTISGSTLTSTTPHFTPAHLQNGTPEHTNSLSNPPNEHWAEQMAEAKRIESAGDKPHFYARNAPSVARLGGNGSSSVSIRADLDEHGERRKPVANGDVEEAGAWDAMDLCGHGLKSIGASVFRHYPNLRKLYFANNKLEVLPLQIGTMRSLTELDLSYNGLRELPPEIGMLTHLKKLLLYGNDLYDLPYELGALHQLEVLGLYGNNRLRRDYYDRVKEHGTRELVRYLREQAPAPPAPFERDWIKLVDEVENESERFTVCSWNTLCDRAATQAAYGYTPSAALAWDHRRGVILDELTHRKADILTLQEVDTESYNEYFRPNLATEDYKGMFWAKGRAQTMGDKEAKTVDGCAIFYKNSKYILLDKQVINYSQEAIRRPDMRGDADVFNRVMPRDHIAVVAFLENRMTGSRLIVVDTHLAWEGWFADVKVVQVAILLERLANLAKTYAAWPPCKDKELFRYANDDSLEPTPDPAIPRPTPAPSMHYDDATQIPMLVCGDFNSTADSGVHDLITLGSLSNSHTDLGTQKYGDFTRNGMTHPFSLKSAYASIAHWPFTNYTSEFREVIDYIWYSTNTLQVTSLLGEVDPEYMRKVPGFPNWHFPSDHLALMAEFVVKGRRERKVVEADFGPGRRTSRH
ncbi:hypothetical protein BAUCODRAFT_63084 [Baudoinia panamericana UAMH 10762]|uniref:CCR4-Not complex 3'-5'-exoribonuclease subunit Ccr4 n=1 Tax=Baudoinia panamericana (strain UAMH 10762) TaxID=717646 RepID=M2NKW3_BAUPA|nr:uncharacterized protein BAUCODRAFT_63084 [Baudoinia panamericana UAMH 10762]EMD00095.1 hypothetical protein BAUCODRAFT_63084 [Baudoinia panamericana UAMH 10762]